MGENLNYTQVIDNIDVKADNIIDGIVENEVKSQAKEYVEIRIKEGISKIELKELLTQIKILLARQDIEKINLRETLKQNIKTQTKESLNIDKIIQDTKLALYEKLGIKFELGENTDIKKICEMICGWIDYK